MSNLRVVGLRIRHHGISVPLPIGWRQGEDFVGWIPEYAENRRRLELKCCCIYPLESTVTGRDTQTGFLERPADNLIVVVLNESDNRSSVCMYLSAAGVP